VIRRDGELGRPNLAVLMHEVAGEGWRM
jgi:hypothetical protein